MTYRLKKSTEVEAFRFGSGSPNWFSDPERVATLENHTVVMTIFGPRQVEDGDWVMKTAFGDLFVLTDKDFRERYELDGPA